MEGKRRYFVRWAPPSHASAGTGEDWQALQDVEAAMTFTLTRSLERRPTTSQIVAHSQRVADLALEIAKLVEIGGSECERLRLAAQLHEIGMVGVPADLLTRRSRLSPAELESVRSQARIGAEIVRASHDPVTARLVERQYEDYRSLRRSTLDSRELLLAGILRIADVYDAMATPRPYQNPVPADRRRQILRVGSGTKFHPAAVFALLHLVEGEEEQSRFE